MLFLISTPIGNLGDITYRAVEVLKACSYLLCEDTRHSRILLKHYEIEKPLISYHQHNESERILQVLADLQEGQQIGLISDAGTPTISDPGQRLIEACHAANIPVSPLPGPCAAIAALSAAGLAATSFQFIGFMPRTPAVRLAALHGALSYKGTTICYESPHRLVKTLSALAEIAPEATAVVARELTKHYEEIRRHSAEALAAHYIAHPPKGEIALLIAGGSPPPIASEPLISPTEAVAILQKQGYTLSAAIKEIASQRQINKRSLYQEIHKQ